VTATLTDKDRSWLLEDEAIWRRAREITDRRGDLDLSDVYHILVNLRRSPGERLARGLLYGRAGARRG
jgi:hypothetical protein